MGIKYILYDYSKDPPAVVTIDSTQLTNLFNTLPKNKKIEFAIQEPNFQPITLGHYLKLADPPINNLLYDSDVDINWATAPARITDSYLNACKPNGKYIRMNASGNPRFILNKTLKELILEHDGKYGRGYFGICNYNSVLSGFFKLPSLDDNFSLKSRNRHQFRQYLRECLGYSDNEANAVPDTKVQGGIGSSYHRNTLEQAVEVWHGNNTLDKTYDISPALEENKYYGFRYSVFDVNGKVRQINELDRLDGKGFKIIGQRDISPPSQFFKKTEFDEWSEFWTRLNALQGGKLYLKQLRMFRL